MVETEREVKSRIAEPRAFGVEEDGPKRPLQNVSTSASSRPVGGAFCIKRGAAKVSKLWAALVEANATAAGMMLAANGSPRAVPPKVLGEDAKAGLFAMEYLAPEDNPLAWKTQLLRRLRRDAISPPPVGRDLAVHPCDERRRPRRSPPRSRMTIRLKQIRIEPSLCVRQAGRIRELASAGSMPPHGTTLATKRALVHGDVSPKNILHRVAWAHLLDAELRAGSEAIRL